MLPASHHRTDALQTTHTAVTGNPGAHLLALAASGADDPCAAMIEAISGGDAGKMAALLLNAPIDVNALHPITGYSLLMQAVTTGHIIIVEALLNAGASVNQPSANGMTALMLAADNGHTLIATTLLAKGARIDAARKDGTTALMFAAKHGESGCAYALVDAGASITQCDANGANAVDIAADWQHHTLAQQLSLRRGTAAASARPATRYCFSARDGGAVRHDQETGTCADPAPRRAEPGHGQAGRTPHPPAPSAPGRGSRTEPARQTA